MNKSLRDTPDVSNAAGLPTSASMSAEVREGDDGSDDVADDHDVAAGDTDRVQAGNSPLPATALLGLWPLLPTLRMVVELGGVRAAATALGVQAPAVSKAIRHLETALGEPLFHRVGRTLRPTERARALHQEVRGAMRVIDSALHATRPLQLVAHSLVTRRVVQAAHDVEVSRISQLVDVDDAIAALRSGAVDAVVGVGAVDGGVDVDVVDCGVVDEVEVGGDAGAYVGDDSAAAAAAVAAGYRAWIVADAAPVDVAVLKRRERPVWLAIRKHSASPSLLRLVDGLKR